LIDATLEAGSIAEPSQKYFVLAHFSRHIRPGMRILDGGSDYTVAAYDEGRKKLVIVAVNWGSSGQYINFELGKFSKPSTDGAGVLRWSTQIGDASGERYKDFTGDTVVKGTKFWSWFGAKTLQTFEVDDVLL
jgi:galactan endo-1,6-beta-galactosidase